MYELNWEEINALYNQRLIEALQSLGHSQQEALSIFNTYETIIDRVDNDWSPAQWAEILQNAIHNGLSPEQWHAKCDWVDSAIAALSQTPILKGYRIPPDHHKVPIKRYLP